MKQLGISLVFILFSLLGMAQEVRIGVQSHHANTILSLQFSHDGKYLVSADQEVMVVWDVETMKPIDRCKRHFYDGDISDAFLSPGGRFIGYTAWRMYRDQIVYDRLNDTILYAGIRGFSADDQFGTIGYSEKLQSFNGQFWEEGSDLQLGPIGYHADGIRLFKIQNKIYHEWTNLDGPAREIALENFPTLEAISYTESNQLLRNKMVYQFAEKGQDDFRYWNLEDGSEITMPKLKNNGEQLIGSISTRAEFYAALQPDGQLVFYPINSSDAIFTIPTTASYSEEGYLKPAVQIAPDDRWVAVSKGSQIMIYAIDFFKENGPNFSYKFSTSKNGLMPVASKIDNQGETIEFIFNDKQSRVWNIPEGIGPMSIRKNPNIFLDDQNRLLPTDPQIRDQWQDNTWFGVSPDGKLAVKRVEKGVHFELVDLKSQQTIRTLFNYSEMYYPNEVRFSEDNKWIFGTTGIFGSPNYIWNAETGDALRIEETDEILGFPFLSHDFHEASARFAVGIETGHLALYNLESETLIFSKKVHSNTIQSVEFFPDGKRLLSTSTDGSAKILDIETQEILCTFYFPTEEDWVVLSPSGLFDSSLGGKSSLFFLVGDELKPEVMELQQLENRYSESGLLEKLLGYSDRPLPDLQGFETVDLYPNIQAQIRNDELLISLEERLGGIGETQIFLNGKGLEGEFNPERKTDFSVNLQDYQQFAYRHPDSTNLISIQVFNESGWLKSRYYNIPYEVSLWKRGNGTNDSWDEQFALNQKMYALCIGTSNYVGEELDLRYADQDARFMARAISSIGSPIFTNGDSLDIFCLTTDTARPETLSKEIEWAFSSKTNITNTLKHISRVAKAEDVLVLYFSGHGIAYGAAEKAQFYYLTEGMRGFDLSDPQYTKKNSLSSAELASWINIIPAQKQVVMLDACMSGKAIEDLNGYIQSKSLNASQVRALERMKNRTGIFMISGSAANKSSYEAGAFGQGLLTYALLNGMRTHTINTPVGQYIDVMNWFQNVKTDVEKLASSINGVQSPMLGVPGKGVASFDIGELSQAGEIPIGKPKPILRRNTLINLDTGNDNLKIVGLLENELLFESEKGAEADLIYVDVSEYEAASYVSGFYQEVDGQIICSVKLFRDGQESIPLNVRPASNPEKAASYILRAILKSMPEIN